MSLYAAGPRDLAPSQDANPPEIVCAWQFRSFCIVPFEIAVHGRTDPPVDDVLDPAEPAVCDHALHDRAIIPKWDREFEYGLLQRRVCELLLLAGGTHLARFGLGTEPLMISSRTYGARAELRICRRRHKAADLGREQPGEFETYRDRGRSLRRHDHGPRHAQEH